MSFPCIQAARRFRAERHLPFTIDGEQVGWIRRDDVPLLQRWPDVFDCEGERIALSAALDTPELRTAALDRVSRTLADSGRLTGWRDERFAIRKAFEGPPLALIERVAARFFGTLTFGVHANGIVMLEAAPRLWIARRSLNKAVDPGKLDNLVGGGIGWGYGIVETLWKEGCEEAGISAELAARATPGRRIDVLAEIPEGVQSEQTFVYDLPLPADFIPINQDGEVSEHRLVTIETALALIVRGEMTVDASLVTLDWLLRAGLVEAATPELAGIEALLRPF